MVFETGDTLLFIGDSITDCGQARPVGEREGLGAGYVSLVNSALGARFPETVVSVLNAGISGNRVTDLEARWKSDVTDLKPDWVSIMIGINDVWRQFDREELEDQVGPEQFQSILAKLVEETAKEVKGIFLMTPFFLETHLQDPMRAKMDQYGAIVREIAEKSGARFVDTQAAFDKYLAKRPTQSLCGDRVHPNLVGHQILADAFLAAI
ncbi:SGNH/GDSL hydrolase family protein [Puniceicoccus vermicola]|uniref:SGNH/GDSL hydrolase family protein n=1 Tax=Puniceicoccus vermicola TaxID=388746 RepID=A0A7X1AVE7_9BACT|nr:SGNH/GDSL hydrolase family protein [Puniceicoccus vermicola]MBC2600672.1 SGNH/GDSL hydrolase family protein [Puniceicoccus vermicola]